MTKRQLVLLAAKIRDLSAELDHNLAGMASFDEEKERYAIQASLSSIKLTKRLVQLQDELWHYLVARG